MVDNRALEARGDVLTYTTPPLPVRYEAIGPVRVELWVSATEPYFDVFARVCDVDRDSASWNVCDALVVLLGPCWPDMPFGILSHRAEFMDHEAAAEQSDALLAEDRTSGRV